MKKWSKRLVDSIYIVVTMVTIVILLHELMTEDFYHCFLCAVTLAVFAVPWIVEKMFRVKVGTGLKLGVWWLMFGAEILGEMNNFYGRIPFWDTLLHTSSGFLAAGLGLSLAMRWCDGKGKIAPIMGVLFAVTFSVTTSVIWEFCEFTTDQTVLTDGQKDRIIKNVSSVKLNPEKVNKPLIIKGVQRTVLYDANGDELYVIEDGYLDVGIIDTMKDMFVNLVGAVVFAWGAWGYLEGKKHRKFVRWFLIEARGQWSVVDIFSNVC